MKKKMITVTVLLLVQIIVLFGGTWLWFSTSVRGSCLFISTQVVGQCPAGTDPIIVPIIAFVVFPPVLAKFLLSKLGQKVSWKRIIIIHAITAILVWRVFVYLDSSGCGCGMV